MVCTFSGTVTFFVDSRNPFIYLIAVLWASGVGHTPQISHRGHMVKSW